MGPTVELMEEVAGRRAIVLQWISGPEGLDQAFRHDRIDLWPAVANFPERRSFMYLSLPGRTPAYWLVTRAGSGAAKPRTIAVLDKAVGADWRVAEYYARAGVSVGVPETLVAVCTGQATAR